ncbi:heparinase II/III domain-containing protein [Microvirga sp. 2TAF3]|uniref:heparinase II/III domain-containing protein n=1 Tax=Microvirga sp. 2TAF3 TaxID=3233014 RepID=UPI003F99D74D
MPGAPLISPSSILYAGDSSSGSSEGQHIIGNKNQWSRLTLNVKNLISNVWCELSFQIGWNSEEESHNAHDFASVGVTFLAEDGSSLDFGYVPGLKRTQIDPFSIDIPGPAYFIREADISRTARICRTFLIPAPAQQLIVTIRSWRNSHPFQVSHLTLRQFDRPNFDNIEQNLSPLQTALNAPAQVRRSWKAVTSEPCWFSYALVPDRRLFIRGQIVNESDGTDGALVRVIFRDSNGAVVPPPYPETLAASAIGAFLNIPIHTRARRFTLELVPPTKAVTVDLGFQSWLDGTSMELITPLEISLEERLLLGNITGDDFPEAGNFLKRAILHLSDASLDDTFKIPATALEYLDQHALVPPLPIQQRIRTVQYGGRSQVVADQLHLGTFPAWALPEEPNWDEDPFRSPAWRHEYHSLSWLLDLVSHGGKNGLTRSLNLALSWSRANPWGQVNDGTSNHPFCLAIRTEVFLRILILTANAPKNAVAHQERIALLGELIRHSFALAESLGQNTVSHSIHRISIAGSLLASAKALPRFPLAHHWASVALAHLRDGFDELLGDDGASIEQSQHCRLEILTFGLILKAALQKIPEAKELGQSLTSRLKETLLNAISLTDPSGMLPPFGDYPPGCHHSPWIRRLVFEYGQDLIADRQIRAALSYPSGPQIFQPAKAGIIAARHYVHGHEWGYFCAHLAEQPHPYGHFDSTSFSFSANGIGWITDPGGSRLQETQPAHQYLISSRAHNVAIPNGREQTAGVGWLHSTTTLEGASIFEIGSNVHGPDYAHRRIFVILSDLKAIAVFDRFTTGESPVSFEGYLHLGPSVIASIVNPRMIVGSNGLHKIRIVPKSVVGRLNGIELVYGRDDCPATMQGFVSQNPMSLDAAGVVRYLVSGQRIVCGGVIIAMDEVSLRAISDIVVTPVLTKLLDPSVQD